MLLVYFQYFLCLAPTQQQFKVLSSANMWSNSDLRNKKLGNAFGQPPLLTGQDHLEHVAAQLFHHYKHLFRRLEHVVQFHYPRLVEWLQKKAEVSRSG